MGQQLIDDSFDQLVPNAASRAQQFLGVIKQTADNEPGLAEMSLVPKQPNRKEDRVILAGAIQVGNMWRKGRPVQLTVFADPMGAHLQVGYQVTRNISTALAGTDFGDRMNYNLSKADNHPDTIRKINGLLSIFRNIVFVPVLEQLVAAVQHEQVPQGQGGFFGN